MINNLQLGIPSFDALFGRSRPIADERSYDYAAYGIRLSGARPVTSLCFIGPDGTGKSVFGLHLAAQYMADVCLTDMSLEGSSELPWSPRVLYISTDLKHHVAQTTWKNFGLELPNRRQFPFYWGYRRDHEYADRHVELAKLDPAELPSTVFASSSDPLQAKVHFVDLVSKTTGDDWSFINRLLALLKAPTQPCAPHLLIIDAVEGFEALVGEKNAFGETTSRRSRIAQIMRTASDKCHVCFIIEEPRNDDRFPEEFVTDVVVRFRTATVNGYARRTVEIVKARGQSHVRGQHPFVIRSGTGSTTGREPNPDELQTNNSYVHVYHSLHYLSREEMKSLGPANPPVRSDQVAAFGITYMDDMLARVRNPVPAGLDDQGLPVQTTTALIGEIATQKTSLATAFLARTFRAFAFDLAEILRELLGRADDKKIRHALHHRLGSPALLTGQERLDHSLMIDKLLSCIRNEELPVFKEHLTAWMAANYKGYRLCPEMVSFSGEGLVTLAAWLAESLPQAGAAVLLTTSNQHTGALVFEFLEWLTNSTTKAFADWPKHENPIQETYKNAFVAALKKHLEARTVCRRLEFHDLSSAVLMQIVQRAVAFAQEKVCLTGSLRQDSDRLPYRRSDRFKLSWNIRVVVDDLSTLKDIYPDIRSDPLFLPFLLSFLELEGVTSLIIDSQIGRPDAVVSDAFDRELRALVPHKLLTWRVPFYGSVRDAITLVPPYPSGLRSVVREVRWESKQNAPNALVVDPELELYRGLERGEPSPIPLEVRLYAETTGAQEYIRQENDIFGKLFTPITDKERVGSVIVGTEASDYDALQDFCNLQTDTLLNHTLIFQVDEFWAIAREAKTDVATFPRGPVARKEGGLYPLGPYLLEQTCAPNDSGEYLQDRVSDPFGIFQGIPAIVKEPIRGVRWERRHYFTRSSRALCLDSDAQQIARIDRVPFTWDFGFLLCPKSMWDVAANRPIVGTSGMCVGDIWSQMPNVIAGEPKPAIKWRTFLGACISVAEAQAERSSVKVKALDVSTVAPESLSCLMLEIWASEIIDSLNDSEQQKFYRTFALVEPNHDAHPGSGLINWLEDPHYQYALYKTWLLLIDALRLDELIDRQHVPVLKPREADGTAAATRHWYKTACGNQLCKVTNEYSLPVRLAGHFSTRGDWFLGMAGGSRSERLGRRALDLLSSRRANFRRLELGIGLPTRDVSSEERFKQLPTALLKRDHHGWVSAVTYGEFIGTKYKPRPDFRWLWRSQLKDYYRHSRLLHKWIGQVVAMWEDLRNRLQRQWRAGFDVYDEVAGLSVGEAQTHLNPLESWHEFCHMCSFLKEQLYIASASVKAPDPLESPSNPGVERERSESASA